MRRAWLLMVVLGGCYGDPVREFLPGHMRDAAPADGVDAPDAPDAFVCSTLATSPAAVTAVNEAGTAPIPAGGPLVDGVYVLESAHWYGNTGAPAVPAKMTWRFAGTLWELASRPSGDTKDEVRSGNLVVDSATTTLLIDITCGGVSPGGKEYTFNVGDGSLDLFDITSFPTTIVTHYVPM